MSRLKKAFAFLLALCISVALLPVRAQAADDRITMTVGDTKTVYASLSKYDNVLYNSCVWESTDPWNVVILSQSSTRCEIQAKGATTKALLHFTFYYKPYSNGPYIQGIYDVEVTVKAKDPTGITVAPADVYLNVGDGKQLSASLSPSGSSSAITWTSSNTTVATVSGGYVQARGQGIASITARTANGLSDSCWVTVGYPALQLRSTVPAYGATEADVNSAVTFTYNTALQQGASFSGISLWDETDSRDLPASCSVSGTRLTLQPQEALRPGHSYLATVPASALKNLEGESLASGNELRFSTRAMAVTSVSPADGSAQVELSAPISIAFDGPISKGSAWDTIILANASGEFLPYRAEVSGSVLTVTPSGSYQPYTTYTLTIPSNALCNTIGMGNTRAYSWSFTTKMSQVELVKSTPVQGSEQTAISEPIILEFNYPLLQGDAFGGITLREKNWDGEISGTASIRKSTLTFCPGKALQYGVPYELAVPAGALKNSEGGINPEPMILRFRTMEEDVREVAAPTITLSAQGASITAGDSAASIYYTLDGGNPAVDGTLYTGPLSLSHEAEIRAVAVVRGSASPSAQARFVPEAIERIMENSYGKSSYAVKYTDMVPTADGGCAVVAERITSSYGHIYSLIKYTADGEKTFEYQQNSTAGPRYEAVCQSTDGSFFVVGDSTSSSLSAANDKQSDAYLAKITASGSLSWHRTYDSGYKWDDYYFAVTATTDGGCIAAGITYGTSIYSGTYKRPFLRKYASNGNVAWTKYTGAYRNAGGSVDQNCFNGLTRLRDGGFVAVGSLYNDSFGSGDWIAATGRGGEDAIAIKYDTNGNVLWASNFGGEKSDRFGSVTATADGGCVAYGWTNGGYDTGDLAGIDGLSSHYLVKYDASGNVQWKKAANWFTIRDVEGTADGGLLVAGTVAKSAITQENWLGTSPKGEKDAILMKLDADCNIVWRTAYGGALDDGFQTAAQAANGGYLAAGYLDSYNPPNSWSVYDGSTGAVARFQGAYSVAFDTEGLGSAYAPMWVREGGVFTAPIGPACTGSTFLGWSTAPGGAVQYQPGASVVPNKNMRLYAVWQSTGAVEVSGSNAFTPGGDITQTLSFLSGGIVSAARIQLSYPSYLQYTGLESQYQNVTATEQLNGTERVLTISCDFQIDNPALPAGALCVLGELRFHVDESAPAGSGQLAPVAGSWYLSSGAAQSFSVLAGQAFTVNSPVLKELTVLGLDEIAGPTSYRVKPFPTVAEHDAEWSVSDPEIASIDDSGRLTPLRNGQVSVIARSGDATGSLSVNISGVRIPLDSLSSSVGHFAENYQAGDTLRTLIVPNGTTYLDLTAGFAAGGNLRDGNGVYQYSDVPFRVSFESLPAVVTLTMSRESFTDTAYTVFIQPETHRVTLDPNGGTVEPAEVIVTIGGFYGSLPTPVREGYSFDGWFTETGGGTKITSDTIVNLTANQMLYAHWTTSFCATIIESGMRSTVIKISGIKDAVQSNTIVVASNYDNSGKMTDSVFGVLNLETETISFSGAVTTNWVLFFLEPITFKPLCEKIPVK